VSVTALKNGYRFKTSYPFFLVFIFVFSLIPLSLQAAEIAEEDKAESLSDIAAKVSPADFSKLNYSTPELSVRLIDRYQPDFETSPEQWLNWEKKRLQLLSDLGDWLLITERINQYQGKVPADYKAWFSLLKAKAQLKASQPEKVRTNVRELLWSDIKLSTEQIAQARRLIIRSYLVEKKPHDAQRAMLRYRQDYGESGVQWKILQAKVLLATRRYSEAVNLLNKETDADAIVLKKLTRLKAGLDASQYVYKKAVKQAQSDDTKTDKNTKRQYWILAYIAAGMKKDPAAEIEALEQALLTGLEDADRDLLPINTDLLWQRYQDYAASLGNQLHLLLGDDQSWFQVASDRFEKQALSARSLFAFLGMKAASDNQRKVSLEQFALSIKKNYENGLLLIERLFSDKSLFSSPDSIPDMIRYMLLDFALSRGKIKRAAVLFEFLPEPPDGEKRLAWDMRRARVLVLGGQYEQAAEVLRQLLMKQSFSDELMNRLMQVVFDFQKVDQHELAIGLFTVLLEKNKDLNFQRELKFWMAESYQALKEFDKSAHLYLTSALMIKDKQTDPWSQTARYRAADVLVQAGLIKDARQIYQQLLKVTKNQNRKSVIKQKLQQIWLIEGKQAHVIR